MNGVVLGVMMLVSFAGVCPAQQRPSATVEPATLTAHLSDDAAPLELRGDLLNEEAQRLTRLESSRTASATAAQGSKAARVFGIVVGGLGGFLAGGRIGYAVAQKPTDDDGVSGLRGVVIGAPLGAVVGAVIGYQLTK